MKEDNKGALLVLLSAIAFSMGGLLIKLIPWQPLSLSSGRCVFSSLIIGLYMLIFKQRIKINKTVIIGAILVCVNLICYVTSTKLTTAANAVVLEYTAPVYIILFSYLFFKIKPKKTDLVICTLVFVGIVIVFVDGLSFGNTLGNLIAVASGVLYAFTMMLNSFEGGDSLSSMLIGHIITVFIGIPSIITEVDFSVRTLVLVSILGIFQAGLGYALLAVGIKHCKPFTASLVASIEPILNPILVAIFYKEKITTSSLIGAIIVIFTVVYYNIKQTRRIK